MQTDVLAEILKLTVNREKKNQKKKQNTAKNSLLWMGFNSSILQLKLRYRSCFMNFVLLKADVFEDSLTSFNQSNKRLKS